MGDSIIPIGVAEMFVFPKQNSAGNTYISMSIIVDEGTANANTDHRITVCGSLDITRFKYSRGNNGMTVLAVCELGNFFLTIKDNGYVPVVYHSLNIVDMTVALIPTMPGKPVSVMQFSMDQQKVSFDSGSPNSKTDYPAADASAQSSIFPTYQQFSQFSKNAMSGMKTLMGRNVLTRDGVAIVVKPRMAQNTMHGTPNEVKFFMSGDPNMPTHWLTMVRILLSDTFAVTQSASEKVNVTITVLQTCDRRSCLGCKTIRLQGLCYAAQQCSVVNCIGTVVNQIKPLCNLGLTLQSNTNEMISLTLGAWMVFTESYSSILEISLVGAGNQLKIEWVDDAFFGYVCSAKDKGGQMAALLTSAIGAGLISAERSIDMNGDRTTLIDSRASARNTIILNGVNAFLYQASLYPLYILIAWQKLASCTTSSLLAVISVSGYDITIGRTDLSRASDLVGGMCMTSFFEAEASSGSLVHTPPLTLAT
jgi:hypothetical protein